MSDCHILFKYHQEDIVIDCKRNELLIDIISRYITKLKLSINEFYFLYNNNKINTDITLAQLNDKDEEILIFVYPIENEEKKNEIKSSNFKNFNQCSDTATKNAENKNEITLKIKIEQNDINKTIKFLGDTPKNFGFGYMHICKGIVPYIDNSNELNENNISLIINGKSEPFKKTFIPKKNGIYLIKLLFKKKLSNCSYMFSKCTNIIDIDFFKFNTENVTNMKNMFYNCLGLKSLNLSSFNTKNVTNMENMFNGCSSLMKLNLCSFNTKNVTDMNSMFFRCSSLIILNLSSFNTENVTNMASMFSGCSSLIKLNLSLFNTKNVSNMSCLFSDCSSLTTLNLSSFNIQNVRNMVGMFSECFSLTKLNLSSFNFVNTGTSRMFYKCINLYNCGSSDSNIIDAFKNED